MSDALKFAPGKFDSGKFASDGPRSPAFADAADRLGRAASIIKDQQLARTRTENRAPESEVYVSSPEEAWTRKYMIQCVGPVCTVRPTDAGALLLPRFQPLPEVQAAPPARVQTVEIAPATPVAVAVPARARAGAKAGAEPIGILIGKPARKRSLLGRVFGR
jgi:hypothetical protein